jgi:hypothetical protein
VAVSDGDDGSSSSSEHGVVRALATVGVSADPSASLEFTVHDAPLDIEIMDMQRQHVSAHDMSRLGLHKDSDGVMVDQADKVYVPDASNLRMRLFVAAHQGSAGHRGYK